MVATLVAVGLIDDAARTDPTDGRFDLGFPPRSLFLVSAGYVLWAPVAVRSRPAADARCRAAFRPRP